MRSGSFILLLLSDVLPNDVFLKAHRTDGITPGPEVLTIEVAGFAAELAGDGNGGFAFQEADHSADLLFRRHLNEHVDVVRHEMALQDAAVFLLCQGMKDLAEPGPDGAVEHFLSHFGHKNEMILTVPLAVRRTIVELRHRESFRCGSDGPILDSKATIPGLVVRVLFCLLVKVEPWLVTLVELVDYLGDYLETDQVITYESMRIDPVAALRKVVDRFELPLSGSEVESAVAAGSMDRMRQKEVERGIAGHDYDRSNPEALRVRRGKVGGFVDYMPAQDELFIHGRIADCDSAAQVIIAMTAYSPHEQS